MASDLIQEMAKILGDRGWANLVFVTVRVYNIYNIFSKPQIIFRNIQILLITILILIYYILISIVSFKTPFRMNFPINAVQSTSRFMRFCFIFWGKNSGSVKNFKYQVWDWAAQQILTDRLLQPNPTEIGEQSKLLQEIPIREHFFCRL